MRKDTIDMIGQSFYDLTVVEKVSDGKYRGAKWLCLCKCGNKTIVYGGHLRANMRKSCGCWSELRIDATGVNKIFSNYKRKAKIRNKSFTLTRDQFESLIKGICHYCGQNPSQILKRQKSKKLQIIYNGIDRKDPSAGYIFENCVPACRRCNQAKSDMTVEEFKSLIERIYKWHMIGL